MGEHQKTKNERTMTQYMRYTYYNHIATEVIVRKKTEKMKTILGYNIPQGRRRTIYF